MPEINDYKKADGSFDSTAYHAAYRAEHKARQDKGELCSQCGAFMLWPTGAPRRCGECKAMDLKEELRHSMELRCPACGHHWRPGDEDDYEVFQEGTHGVICSNCDHEFDVETAVSYSFTSPERISEEGKHES